LVLEGRFDKLAGFLLSWGDPVDLGVPKILAARPAEDHFGTDSRRPSLHLALEIQFPFAAWTRIPQGILMALAHCDEGKPPMEPEVGDLI
jgi:hypothetical protein